MLPKFSYASRVAHSRGSADAGFSQGWTAGVTIGNNMYNHVGGELRYNYIHSAMKLTSGNTSAKFGGEAHAIHYDFLLHLAPNGEKTRPYISFGAGIKYFRGTGDETLTQPLSNFALLTRTNDTIPIASIGFGVKFRISPKVNLRAEFKDYIGPVPTKIIWPNRGGEA